MGRDTKRKLYLRKTHFSVIEKYVEDVKQEEKHVPDLLESIMRSTCLVKEELRTHSCQSIKRLANPFGKNKSILLRRPRPWPGPGPLRRRMEKIKKERPNIRGETQKCGFCLLWGWLP